MEITAVKTTPYQDQIPGTSGLRKKVSVVKQKYYVENFVQAVFDCLDGFEGKTLVVGGDGRYYNDHAVQSILKLAIANQCGRVIVGQNGLLSTPASSHIIVKYQAVGGFILSASHNPGGPNGDFGIKYDNEHGAPAPREMTDRFAARAKTIDHFWSVDIPDIDLSVIGEQVFGQTTIQVIDPVDDYVAYMRQIFDFKKIQSLFDGGFTMVYDAMNAVTGPYAVRIFEDIFGQPKGTVRHAVPLPDFGGLHPEPNLTHAHDLVNLMYTDNAPDFAAASDGDGDRYMILGRSFFLNPSDSLAILTKYLKSIPYYATKMTGVARSMPTSFAADFVAAAEGIALYQTPTGWKFFGNLLTAKKIALCGEESFGAGSCHLQEKDGIWAILCWLNILAQTHKNVEEITTDMWKKHGRVFAMLQSYEGIDKQAADTLMSDLKTRLNTLSGMVFKGQKITAATSFAYTDPVTQELTDNQGICLSFGPDARIVFRLSGTGSSGATLRVYLNKRVQDATLFTHTPSDILSDLADISRDVCHLKQLTGFEQPNMIT